MSVCTLWASSSKKITKISSTLYSTQLSAVQHLPHTHQAVQAHACPGAAQWPPSSPAAGHVQQAGHNSTSIHKNDKNGGCHKACRAQQLKEDNRSSSQCEMSSVRKAMVVDLSPPVGSQLPWPAATAVTTSKSSCCLHLPDPPNTSLLNQWPLTLPIRLRSATAIWKIKFENSDRSTIPLSFSSVAVNGTQQKACGRSSKGVSMQQQVAAAP